MKVTIAGGLSGEVDVHERKPRISPHTGRALRNGTMRIRISREHDALMTALPGRVLDSDDGRWLVVRRAQHSSQDGSRTAEHVFEIEEFENRAASILKIADLELKPEKYHEGSSRDDSLQVTARVVLADPKQLDRLQEILAAEEPVPVIREGVHDAPRQMVVSVLGWSEREGEYVFELQCKEPDTRKPSSLIGWHWAMADAETLAYLLEWRLAMSTLLVEKGLVSKEEIDRVDDAAVRNTGKRRINFVKVEDVRAHPFKGDTSE